MIIKTEHSFVHLRVPKISLELWLNSSSKIRGGPRRQSGWTRSMKGSMVRRGGPCLYTSELKPCLHPGTLCRLLFSFTLTGFMKQI